MKLTEQEKLERRVQKQLREFNNPTEGGAKQVFKTMLTVACVALFVAASFFIFSRG